MRPRDIVELSRRKLMVREAQAIVNARDREVQELTERDPEVPAELAELSPKERFDTAFAAVKAMPGRHLEGVEGMGAAEEYEGHIDTRVVKHKYLEDGKKEKTKELELSFYARANATRSLVIAKWWDAQNRIAIEETIFNDEREETQHHETPRGLAMLGNVEWSIQAYLEAVDQVTSDH